MNRHGEVHASEWTVTARLAFTCHGHRCTRIVASGEDYVRLVAFPGHDANGSKQPWVLKICAQCWREPAGLPLPPHRTTPDPGNPPGFSHPKEET